MNFNNTNNTLYSFHELLEIKKYIYLITINYYN